MIDPSDVIKFDRTDPELQEWFLFSVVVAGKTASTMAKMLDNYLQSLPGTTPFDKIAKQIDAGTLEQGLREYRLGKYTTLVPCFTQVVERQIDLRTCSLADLETITGIGPKTARMFIMHSRPNQRVSALDVHVLRHLRANGHPDAPKATPSSVKQYRKYEDAFLAMADASGLSPSEYDLEVWKLYSVSNKKKDAADA